MVTTGRSHYKGKLTFSVQQTIVTAIRAGNYFRTAAALAGIAAGTFNSWMKLGEEQEEAGVVGKYRNFRTAVLAATAEAENAAVKCIFSAMPDDWRAAEAYLKRRFPERWGKEVREYTGEIGVKNEHHYEIDITYKMQQYQDAYARVLERVGAGGLVGGDDSEKSLDSSRANGQAG